MPLGDQEDDAFEQAVLDPATIETHEHAIEVIDLLESDIAKIEAQLEVARCEASFAPLSAERLSWVRRAAGALAWKKGQRHRVMQRDKEIRRMKGTANTPPLKDPAVSLAKRQQEHARKIAQIAIARSDDRLFRVVARERLDQEMFDNIASEAKRRRAALLETADAEEPKT